MKSPRVLLLAAAVAGCGGESPAGLPADVESAPPVLAVEGTGAVRTHDQRWVFYQGRYYEHLGVVRHCQAVPTFEVAPSDFLRAGPSGDLFVHVNDLEAYVMVSEAPARFDPSGNVVEPEPTEYAARWIGRGRLSARAWLSPDGRTYYSRNWTVEAIVGSAAEAGVRYVALQGLAAADLAPFEAAAESGTETVRCRLHTVDFLGRIMANDVTVEPLRGEGRGKGGR